MAPPKQSHGERLAAELSSALTSKVATAKDLQGAMQTITAEMLKNNPYVPPTSGCPINEKLPNELLAHIFMVGVAMEKQAAEEDSDDEEYYDEYTKDFSMNGDSDMDEEQDTQKEDTEKEDTKKSQSPAAIDGDDAMPSAEADNASDSSEADEVELPFQVLVSHVCSHWRRIAIEASILWTIITFDEGAPFEKSRVYIERSKTLPLDIQIDCTPNDEDDTTIASDDATEASDIEADAEASDIEADTEAGDIEVDTEVSEIDEAEVPDLPPQIPASNDVAVAVGTPAESETETDPFEGNPQPTFSLQDINDIVDIIAPHLSRWRTLEVIVHDFQYMHVVLERLAQFTSGASLLETLQLFHHEDAEEYETFEPAEYRKPFILFGNNTPKLSVLVLWGIHMDWESTSMFKSLTELMLSYHAKDVRPSYEQFRAMLTSSPSLETLSLSLSGPSGEPSDWPRLDGSTESYLAESVLIDLPTVKNLQISYHEPAYICGLLPRMILPNVTSLKIDFDGSDYSDFVRVLASPVHGLSLSLLAGLDSIKIGGLPCDRQGIDILYEQLGNVTAINLNCACLEEEWLDVLTRPVPTSNTGDSTSNTYYCPLLTKITTTGITGAALRRFVEVRRNAGYPIKTVSMSENDPIDEKEEKWLQANLESLEFFEPSDEEEDLEDDLVIDEMDVDED